MKKYFKMAFIILIGCFLMVGCATGISGKYVAKDGRTLVMKNSGECTLNGIEGNYKIDGNKITFVFNSEAQTWEFAKVKDTIVIDDVVYSMEK